MVLKCDIFGDYFMSTELVNRIFNALIYGWLNEIAGPVLV